MRYCQQVSTAFAILLFARFALGEVADKVGPPHHHWPISILLTVGVFAAGVVRWWIGAVFLLVPLFLGASSISVALDPYMGRALWAELGWTYFLSQWSADLLMLVAGLLGVFVGWKRSRAAEQSGT